MWLIVGISGVTCGGKSTLARALCDIFPNVHLICQDDYFLPKDSDQHTWILELNHINWEIMSSLDMKKMWKDICTTLSNGKKFSNASVASTSSSDKVDQHNTQEELQRRNYPDILIIEGFLIFNYPPIAEICHLKYHLTLTRDKCWERRSAKTYDPPDVPGFFDHCVWPSYEKHREEMLKQVQGVKIIDGSDKMDSITKFVASEMNTTAEMMASNYSLRNTSNDYQ